MNKDSFKFNLSEKNKIIEYFFILFFTILWIGLSIHYYLPSTTYLDNSLYVYSIITSENLYITFNRYIAILPQILPVIGLKLNLPFETILKLYSLNSALIYLFVFFLLRFYFKNYNYAYSYLIILLGLSHFSYYFISEELKIGIIIIPLIFATILSLKKSKLFLILIFGILLAGANITAIALAAISFILFAYIHKNKQTFVYIYVLLIEVLVIKLILPIGAYQKNTVANCIYELSNIKGILNSNVIKFMYLYFIKDSLLIIKFGLIAIIVFFFFNKKVAFAFILYILLMLIVLYLRFPINFSIENLYKYTITSYIELYVFSMMFIMLNSLFLFYNELFPKYIKISVLPLACLFCILFVIRLKTTDIFEKRIATQKIYIENAIKKNIIYDTIDANTLDPAYFFDTQLFENESIIISNIEYNKSIMIYVLNKDKQRSLERDNFELFDLKLKQLKK